MQKSPLFILIALLATQTVSAADLPAKKILIGQQSKQAAIENNKEASGNQLSTETHTVLKAISERNARFKYWSAEFTQENYSIGLGQGQFSKGTFTFSYPQSFRYSLTSPEVADYICDGKTFWQIQYREGRGKSAFVREFVDLSKVELEKYLFLLRGIDTLTPQNEAKLLKNFVITGKSIDDELHLILEPRKSNEIVRMTLIFKQSESVLYRAVLEDALGTKTTITLVSHKLLKTIDPKTFVADYPRNSKVEKIE
jgi:outer membrane lipoprotein-sorting protein